MHDILIDIIIIEKENTFIPISTLGLDNKIGSFEVSKEKFKEKIHDNYINMHHFISGKKNNKK